MIPLAPVRRMIEQASPAESFLTAVALAIGVVAVDAATGPALSFSFFYVLPIVILTWRFGRRAAVVASIAAAVVWLAVDLATGPERTLSIPIWNSLIRVAFFLTIAGLLVGLRTAVDRESELARVDALTGLANRRAFEEAARRELARAERTGEPLTVAVADLDDLKLLNDALGHAGGDAALVAVAEALSTSIRSTDLAARIGGDEFAVVLSDSGADARAALERIVAAVSAASTRGHRLSCSVGAVSVAGGSLDDALEAADAALYDAKRTGKGRLSLRTGG